MPLFSIVIPTHNRRQRLLRALESVRAQRFSDYEIVVVDDGSADGTRQALQQSWPQARVFVQENRGAAAARNLGVSRASGTYVAFLDSDDSWPPWTLACYAELIAAHAPSWLYGRRRVTAAAAVAGLREEPLAAVRFDDYQSAVAADGLVPMPSGVAVRRDVFLRAGGFEPALHVAEDVDLWFRLGRQPGFVRMDAPVAFAREVGSDSLSQNLPLAATSLLQVAGRERRGLYAGNRRVWRALIASELMGYAWQCRSDGRIALAARLYAALLELQLRSRFWEPAFGGRRNRYLVTFLLHLLSPQLHDRVHARAARAAARR